MGRNVLLALSLGCYIGLAVLLPTGALVTAGFTFNETFLYWFPNFGFSFLLLGIVLASHLMGPRIAYALQIVGVGTVFICLAILTVVGLLQGPTLPSADVDTLTLAGRDWFYLMAAIPLLFLGLLNQKPALLSDSTSVRESISLTPLLVATIFLALWATASLFHVPQNKLAGSTIPYIFSAREILGQLGRVLIGLTIVGGALALLNGLLILLQVELMSQFQRFELKMPSAANTQRLVAVLVCFAIGVLMAAGLAGHEVLELLIKSVLGLWLFLTGLKAFLRGLVLRQLGLLVAPAFVILVGPIYLFAATGSLFPLKVLLILMTGSFAVTTVWTRLSR